VGNRLRYFLAQGILAFSPAVLVLLVTREDAPSGGDLSVALGVVDALYSVAYLGQRGYVSVRGFDQVPARAGLTLRIAASLLMATPALLVSWGMGLALHLAMFVVAMKLTESLVDLWVGMRVRLSNDEANSRDFLVVAVLRTVLVLTPVVWLGRPAPCATPGSCAASRGPRWCAPCCRPCRACCCPTPSPGTTPRRRWRSRSCPWWGSPPRRCG
jgi:hypothetical protein